MATTTNQDALKAARNHFKKHKKKYIIGGIVYAVFMVLLIVLGVALSGSTGDKADDCMIGKMTCEEYDKDHKERCETYLETDDEYGFNDERENGKTCKDLGFEWVDKEAEEQARIEAEKQQCESEGKRWYNDSSGCVTHEEATRIEADAQAARERIQAREDALNDAKRKCTVMEAADLNRAGNSDIFGNAKTNCESMYASVYKYDQDLFIGDVTTDWNSRKNELINGNNLTYHLNNLGW